MSTESQIAAFTQQAGLLLDLPQQIKAAADLKIETFRAAFMQRIDLLTVTAYVNQATGDDANAGTVAAPLRSIEAALAKTPYAGRCFAILQGPYTFQSDLLVTNKWLSVASDSSVRHEVDFVRRLYTAVVPNTREVAGVRLLGDAHVLFYGLKLNVPALDGNWPTFTPTPKASLVSGHSSATPGRMMASFAYCDINIPAAPYCPLIGSVYPMSLFMTANVALVTALNGNVASGVTAAGGTSVATLPWLVSNMATI